MKVLKQIFSQKSHWQINKDFAKTFGIDCAILISDLIDKNIYFGTEWFFNTSENIEEDTTLTYHLQKKALKILIDNKFIETKLIGIPAKLHFKINQNNILNFFNSSFDYSQKQVLENFKNLNANNLKTINKNKYNNIKLHSSEFHSEGKFILFSEINDINSFMENKKFNHSYFYIAYRFWELWKTEFPNHKHLKNTKSKEWYDAIRLMIESDKQSIDRVVAIYIYFTKCQEKEKGFEDMLFSEVKSLPALRKETRSGVYRIDQIIDKVNSKLQSNKDFNIEVSNAITKFKNKFKCEK